MNLTIYKVGEITRDLFQVILKHCVLFVHLLKHPKYIQLSCY